jgi:hypothetical protein
MPKGQALQAWITGPPHAKCGQTSYYIKSDGKRGRCVTCNRGYLKNNKDSSPERELMRRQPCPICTLPMHQPCYDEVGNVFRGRVCHDCNKGMGHLKENVDIVRKAALWIETGGWSVPLPHAALRNAATEEQQPPDKHVIQRQVGKSEEDKTQEEQHQKPPPRRRLEEKRTRRRLKLNRPDD